jgi:hypothetical protein
LLIQAGEHPLVVARRLGHTSVKTVLDVYGHLFEGMDVAAAVKLDEKSRTRRAPMWQILERYGKPNSHKGLPGGRYRVRTCDLCRVKAALYH